MSEYIITPIDAPVLGKYDAIIVAVVHNEFKEMGISELRSFAKPNHVIYDVKYALSRNDADGRL